jgi:hypothetical protein
MLEKAITTTRRGQYTYVQYARFADDPAPHRRRLPSTPQKQILGRRGRSPPGAVFPRTGESALPRLTVSGKLLGSDPSAHRSTGITCQQAHGQV